MSPPPENGQSKVLTRCGRDQTGFLFVFEVILPLAPLFELDFLWR